MLPVEQVAHTPRVTLMPTVSQGAGVGGFKVLAVLHRPRISAPPSRDSAGDLSLGHPDTVDAAKGFKRTGATEEPTIVNNQRTSVSQYREPIAWAAVQDVEHGPQVRGF